MMLKKIVAIGMSALLMVGALAGCGDKKSEDAAADGKGEGKKIALIMSHMTNDFTNTFSKAAKAEGEKLGYEVDILDGNKDLNKQINQIESAINQNYAGIMCEPISVSGLDTAIEKAKEAKIPFITVIQKIENQEIVDSYAGGNDQKAGEIEMTEAIKAIEGKGNIAVLYGPMGGDAQIIREKGYQDALKDYPDVNIVFAQTANWKTDEAMSVVENWLSSGTEINAIVAQNDEMAIGAIKALESANKLEDVKVYGVDAIPAGVEAIKDGKLTGTISQSVEGMGELSTQTLDKIIKGETVDPEYLTEAVFIDKSNVDSLD